MGKIIAIGGGSIAEKITLLFDKEIVKLSGKKSPNILFIPTASGDSEDYYEAFKKVYRDLLKCTIDVLYLVKKAPPSREIKEKIEKADVIYVGGGNTLRMMKIWRRRGVDGLLIDAYDKGKVMCGVSAGAICWFAYGNSDSRRYSSPDNWKPIRVSGLGLLPYTICPHYHKEKREKGFAEMLQKHHIKEAFALDDGTALKCVNEKIEVLKVNASKRAYKITTISGATYKEAL